MVGIHERSGRSKIFSSQIAHILNDETQRKYLQAVKRTITISQKLYPPKDLSQCFGNYSKDTHKRMCQKQAK